MCISSNSNITFLCKLCNTSIKYTDIAAQCDLCQFWSHMKCNNLNHIDCRYLQGSNDPWFCISCCNEIFPFGTLANKNVLSMMMVNSSPTTIKNNDVDATNTNSTCLVLKPSANLSLEFNQFNNFPHEQKTEPENVVNSNYYDIDQFQTLKFHEKHKSVSLFYINTCSLSKNIDDLQHLLKCTNNVFDIIAVSETRIARETALTSNINLQNYSFEFTPTNQM